METNDMLTKMALKEDEELSLRPQTLNQYIGQNEIKDMLHVYIQAAKKRVESLDHMLLYGPPGLGKTTLAFVTANELGVKMKVTSGPAIERSGDLAALLTSLEPGDVLFIDEIHRLPRQVEEVLYAAMEDYVLDIVIGKDHEARSIRIDLPPFTLVGATTRFGDLSAPLRDRFGVVFRLNYYNNDDLAVICKRTASVYGNPIDDEAIKSLSMRSRGTPRIVNRLFRRVRDFADIMNDGYVTDDITNRALLKLGIDPLGLDQTDYRYLEALITRYKGGPAGLEAIAASISEEVTTVEDVYEPFLLQEGFISRTPRGRIATKKAYQTLNIPYYEGFLDT